MVYSAKGVGNCRGKQKQHAEQGPGQDAPMELERQQTAQKAGYADQAQSESCVESLYPR